jgi:hypothetical protein
MGDFNTAVGAQALGANTAGFRNTAVGLGALENLTSGFDNIGIGVDAGSSLTSSEERNIDIGNTGVTGESSTVRIGTHFLQIATFIEGIRGVATGNNDAVPVLIDSAGQLGTMSSSRRFKKEIKPMDSASKAILALKPVTFRYKSDSTNRPEFGLIAEEVAEANPDLVVRDEKGEIYTVRYEAVNAMLLNEFLKQHKKVQEQGATIARLEKQIEALSAGLQKLSAQLATASPSRVADLK